MAVLKVRKNGQWIVVGTGEKGEKGDAGNVVKTKTVTGGTELYQFLKDNFDNVINIKTHISSLTASSTTIAVIGGTTSSSSLNFSDADFTFFPTYHKGTTFFYFLSTDNNYFIKFGNNLSGGLFLYINGIYLSDNKINVLYASANLPANSVFNITYYEN